MSKLSTTCGVFLFHGRDLLICHPTGADSSNWSIPKGVVEAKEDYLEAAIREFKEETGVYLPSVTTLIDLMGERKYKSKKKTLCGYIAFCEREKPDSLVCSSFTPGGKLEVDLIEWTPITVAIKLIHETQRGLLLEYLRGLSKGSDHDYRAEGIRDILI